MKSIQNLLTEAVKARSLPDMEELRLPAANESSMDLAQYLQAASFALTALNLKYRELLPQLLARKEDERAMAVAKRYSHMVEMTISSEELAESYGLDAREGILAAVCDFAHDGGRFLEALRNEDTLKQGTFRRHSELSVQILQETGALRLFTQEEQEAIRLAVLHHAEREVDQETLPEGSLARKLCYMIRDDDKQDILLRNLSNYTEAENIARENVRHFYSRWFEDWESVRDHPDFDEMNLSTVRETLQDLSQRRITQQSTVSPDTEKMNYRLSPDLFRHDVGVVVRGYMDGSIHFSIIDEFAQQKSLDVRQAWHSHATYWLVQLGMIFDLESPQIIQNVLEQGGIQERLRLIKPRVSESDYERISDTLLEFCIRKCKGISESEIRTYF